MNIQENIIPTRMKVKQVIFIAEDENGNEYQASIYPYNKEKKRHDITAAFWDDASVGRLLARYYPKQASTFEGVRTDWQIAKRRYNRATLTGPFSGESIYPEDVIHMWQQRQGGEGDIDEPTIVMLKTYDSRPDKVDSWKPQPKPGPKPVASASAAEMVTE